MHTKCFNALFDSAAFTSPKRSESPIKIVQLYILYQFINCFTLARDSVLCINEVLMCIYLVLIIICDSKISCTKFLCFWELNNLLIFKNPRCAQEESVLGLR